jgi:deazaflavin-dependent oxidoreductase (nitroreductase family)
MDESVRKALEHGRAIDITTTGRKSGSPRRIEIEFYNLEGRVYLWSRTATFRNWFANLRAHPEFIFHLKGSVQLDLPARAALITDRAERRNILSKLIQMSKSDADLEALVEAGPLVEVTMETDLQ